MEPPKRGGGGGGRQGGGGVRGRGEERTLPFHSPQPALLPPPPVPSSPPPPPRPPPGAGDFALPWPLLPAAKRAAGSASEAPSPSESGGTFASSRVEKLIINRQVNGDGWGAEGVGNSLLWGKEGRRPLSAGVPSLLLGLSQLPAAPTSPGTRLRALSPPAPFAEPPHPRSRASVAQQLPAGRGRPRGPGPKPGPGRGGSVGGGAFPQSLNPPHCDDWAGQALSPNTQPPTPHPGHAQFPKRTCEVIREPRSTSGPALSNGTFCSYGNVLYLCCQIQ